MANKSTSDITNYERPALTADCVLFRFAPVPNTYHQKPMLQVCLTRRPNAPEKDKLALLGAFVPVEERIEDVLKKCVANKGGYEDFYYQQFYTFDTPKRDERWRVISVSYIGIVKPTAPQIVDIPNTDWYVISGESLFNINNWDDTANFDDLAFDHGDILRAARNYLKENVFHTKLVFHFLPDVFTIKEFQQALETIGQKFINNVKRDFGKWLEETKQTTATNKDKKEPHRPAKLFKWKKEDKTELNNTKLYKETELLPWEKPGVFL